MTEATDSGVEDTNPADTLSAAEQASIEAGRRGLTEPTGVNELPAEGPQRPEHVPEQFWKDGKIDAEGLAKSYAELRSKMDGKKPEEAPEADPAAAPATDATGKIKAADEAPADDEGEGEGGDAPNAALQSAMEAARTEWAETQEVTEDTVAALEAAGIPRDIFNLYLEGLRAQTEQTVGAIHSYAGGKEQYEAMTSWAAKNLKAEEIEAFNSALDNPQLRETAVTGLLGRFQKAAPSEGSIVTPTDTPAAGNDVFQSRDDLIAAQKDPRYSADANYRQSVMEKLARSQQGGFAAFDRPRFQRSVLSN